MILFASLQEIGFTHMRISDGVNSLLQLTGLCSRLCAHAQAARAQGGSIAAPQPAIAGAAGAAAAAQG
jgi:hypothetical protein